MSKIEMLNKLVEAFDAGKSTYEIMTSENVNTTFAKEAALEVVSIALGGGVLGVMYAEVLGLIGTKIVEGVEHYVPLIEQSVMDYATGHSHYNPASMFE